MQSQIDGCLWRKCAASQRYTQWRSTKKLTTASSASTTGLANHAYSSPAQCPTPLTANVLTSVKPSHITENRRSGRPIRRMGAAPRKVRRPFSRKPTQAPDTRPARLATGSGKPKALVPTNTHQSSTSCTPPTMPKLKPCLRIAMSYHSFRFVGDGRRQGRGCYVSSGRQ